MKHPLALQGVHEGTRVEVGPRLNPYWEEHNRFERLPPAIYAEQCLSQHARMWKTYSYALTDPRSLAFVAGALGPLAIEMGAATGYWAWQLSQRGLDIRAYDSRPPRAAVTMGQALPDWSVERGFGFPLRARWFPVRRGTPVVLRDYGDRSLFLCFPPFKDGMAEACLCHYPGDTLVLIGTRGTPVGTKAFFSQLERWGGKGSRTGADRGVPAPSSASGDLPLTCAGARLNGVFSAQLGPQA